MTAFVEELLPEFRRIALERLDRVEAAWQVVLTRVDDAASTSIHHELHTLKGESRLMGLDDVHKVCHRLEDLLEVARGRGYAIDEDFDLAVNMALRFLAMLVRKKVGVALSGIDLPGFLRQIDTVIEEAKRDTVVPERIRMVARPVGLATKVPPALRMQLADIAFDVFLEFAHAHGARRNRLRTSWYAVRDLIGVHRAIVGPAQLGKHKAGALGLARDLGKQIDVVFQVETAEISADVFAAIDLALLHLMRNAIDHGIESAEQRTAAGKPARGRIEITSGMRDGAYVLAVGDDGGGIDFPRIHARGVELGLVKSTTQSFDGDRWVDLICHSGLSTRDTPTEISGRGVGLDAVRATVLDVGGKLTMTSNAGVGTTWTVTVPAMPITVAAHVLRVPQLAFPVAIDASWTAVADHAGEPEIDLARYLGFDAPSSAEFVTCFSRGGIRRAICIEHPSIEATVRRLVVTPPHTPAEIITHDGVEGLLLRMDLLAER